MPEDVIDPNELEAAIESPPESGGGSLFAKIKVLLFILVVVVGECVVAYLWLPSASETEAWAGAAIEANVDAKEAAEEAQRQRLEEASDLVEVDLGEFHITAFQPVSNTTLRIDFHLYGTVAQNDKEELETLKKEHEHRFREQVIVIMRRADITDLTDAGLGLIKRQILEKTNAIFGKPLLKVVIFSEFSFIEQ